MLESNINIHQVCCPKHPNTHSELFFCIDDNRVFCVECQEEQCEIIRHKDHKSKQLARHLQERRERFDQIRAQIQESNKKQENLEWELKKHIPNVKKEELESCFDIVDQFSKAFHWEEGETKNALLKEKIQQRAGIKWAAHPNFILLAQAEKELETAQATRAALEREIRRAEADEQRMAECNRDIDELAERMSSFMRREIPLPAPSDFVLLGLKCSLIYSLAEFEGSDVDEIEDQLFSCVDQLRDLTINETRVIEKERLQFSTDRYDPCISGIVHVDANLFLALDGFNTSIKLLDIDVGVGNQVLFSRAVEVEMAGLFAPSKGSAADLLLCVEFEGSKDSEKCETLQQHSTSTRLVVLLRKPSKALMLLDTLPLSQRIVWLYPTFAHLPNGNVLLGVSGFTRVYELEVNDSTDSSDKSLQFSLKPHQLPDVYCCICDFRVGREWHLAAAFDDDTVRMFVLSDGLLSEECLLPPLPAGHRPTRILLLRPGVLCFTSAMQNADNTWSSFLDVVAYDSSGRFFQPYSLLEYNGTLVPLTTFVVPSGHHPKVGLVALDWDTKALHFYEINV